MILAHRIALDATYRQRKYFARAAGCDRLVWNLALENWNNEYVAGGKPSAMELKKKFNATKYEHYPWMRDIHRDAHADPFERLGKAWSQFFKDLKSGKKAHRPTFHKRGRKDSFYVSNDRLEVAQDGWSVRLPVVGWIRLREQPRFTGKIMGARVSRTADRWFISIQFDVEDIKAVRGRTANGIAGIDVGLKDAAVISRRDERGYVTREHVVAPKPLKKALRKLRRMQRSISRRKKGGKNREKLVRKVARIHARVASIRKDFWHKLTTRLCRENQAIGVEDLNVKGMMQNRRLSRALADVGFGMMRPMLEYKANLYNTRLRQADKWYPSSKKCSRCGHVKELLSLAERAYECDQCGHLQDRDENASDNLRMLAEEIVPTACGESTLGDSKTHKAAG